MNIGSAQVLVLPDEAGVARETARRIVEGLAAALDERGAAHLVLTGGLSAVSLYRELAGSPWRDAIAWSDVHMWWGDDRFVPRDHPDSNAGLAYRTLFADAEVDDAQGIVVDPDKVHPIPAEEAIAHGEGPDWAAERYAESIDSLVPKTVDGVPAFDVLVAGIGTDGHTMSIFPDSPALATDAPFVMGIPAPTHVEPHLARVTLSARVLPAATTVLMMTSGSAKAELMASVLGANRDPAMWPAQAAILPNAVWLLDEAAAALLPNG